MKQLIRGHKWTGLTLLLILSITFTARTTADAKTLTRYTTQTVTLRDSRNGKAIRTIKRNTKVKLIRSAKVWARVTYKNKLYKVKKRYLCESRSPKKYTAAYFRRAGVIRWGGVKWTYYSQRLLPGTGLKIPGRHVDSQGFVCDKDDYIVIAVTPAMRKARAIVPTPFGKFGKVYDCGAGGSAWRDVYTAF